MLQLTFDLPRRTALGRADFLVSACNAAAVGWIDRWPDWPRGVLVIHGQTGCGKTHLGQLWCERASAVNLAGEDLDEKLVTRVIDERRDSIVVDGADRAPEQPLLHLYNWCSEHAGSVLLTGRRPPALWPTALADLDSRLRAALAIEIGLPDDALLAAVLVKHFADRQLRVDPAVVLYLISRTERSFAAVAGIAEQLDAVSLRDGRAITVSLAREVVAGFGNHRGPLTSNSGVR